VGRKLLFVQDVHLLVVEEMKVLEAEDLCFCINLEIQVVVSLLSGMMLEVLCVTVSV